VAIFFGVFFVFSPPLKIINMKKILVILTFLVCAHTGKSQELGIRFGDVIGSNVAVDAVFPLGKFSRVHADVSFGNDALGVEALWNFLYKPLGGEELHWYLGVGPSLRIGDPFRLGASGEIGLQYTFNSVPISLSADWRPTFWIVENTDLSARGFGFNIRYVFGKVAAK
jgi:hypothetical protein